MRSPDPEYRHKWQLILERYADAIMQPDRVVILFQDEMTYYRKAEIKGEWQETGPKAVRLNHRYGPNTKARIAATLNGVTGQVTFLQRHKIGKEELVLFYKQIRAAYPDAESIYLVQDNWPVHKLDEPISELISQAITPLFLPTYASWLNPIEKLWRWLRQDILHNHRLSQEFKALRKSVVAWLEQFTNGSGQLLHYVGLLSQEELSVYQY